jgi:hypothetical protein
VPLHLTTLLLLPLLTCPLPWQGRPGYYRRLLDLPSLCPHLSLASPWAPRPDTPSELLLLALGNLSLSLAGWEAPRPKAAPPLAAWRARYGRRRADQLLRKCNRHYRTVHCGPVAVPYSLVVLRWPGRAVEFGAEGVVALTSGNTSTSHLWGGWQPDWDEPEVVVTWGPRRETLRYALASPRHRPLPGEWVGLRLGDGWHLNITLTEEEFNIWGPEKDLSPTLRPWLSLLAFPLGAQVLG